ncbi:MAG: phytanoyl-CoA dioxygenase family protein [Pseudomonadota bacterium]
MAGQVMRSRCAQFFHEHAFMKEAGTQHATPWHQDIPYYCVSGEQSVSIYVALDEVAQEQAVQYVRGSHRWNETYYPTVWLDESEFNVGGEGYTGSVPDIEANRDEYDIASWPLQAGDTILFSFKTLHGTTAATMPRGRSAFSTRWMGDDIHYLERDGITSPPYENMGTQNGERMREDWFPVVWKTTG